MANISIDPQPYRSIRYIEDYGWEPTGIMNVNINPTLYDLWVWVFNSVGTIVRVRRAIISDLSNIEVIVGQFTDIREVDENTIFGTTPSFGQVSPIPYWLGAILDTGTLFTFNFEAPDSQYVAGWNVFRLPADQQDTSYSNFYPDGAKPDPDTWVYRLNQLPDGGLQGNFGPYDASFLLNVDGNGED